MKEGYYVKKSKSNTEVLNYGNYKERTLFYCAKTYTGELQKNEDYLNLKNATERIVISSQTCYLISVLSWLSSFQISSYLSRKIKGYSKQAIPLINVFILQFLLTALFCTCSKLTKYQLFLLFCYYILKIHHSTFVLFLCLSSFRQSSLNVFL